MRMLYQEVFGVFLLFTGWCRGLPAGLPSTSVNLPVEEAKIVHGEYADIAVADTYKDHATEEYTFKEPKLYDFIQNTLTQITQPVPVVDNLKEEDKYGNNGDKLEGLGNFVVKGTEAATQLASTAVGVPARLIRTLSTKTTELLNRLGGQLIGLGG